MALTLADRIVEAIPDTEYTTFAELQRKLGAKKSTLSEALRKLESTGVVEKRTEGKTVFVRRAKARPLSKIFADSDIVAEAPLAPRIFGGPMSRLGGPCVVRPINAYVRVGLRTIAEDPKPHLKFRTISVLDPLSGLTRRIDEDIQRFEFYPFEIIRTHSEKKRLRFHSYEANVETAFDSGCGLGINAALNVAFILAICFDLGEIQSKEPFQNEADRKVLHKMSYWLEQKTYTRRFAPAPSTEQTSEQSPPSSGASVHCSILGSSRGMFYHYEAPSKPKVSAEPNAVVSLPVDTDPLDLVVGERKRQWIIPENPLFPDGDLSKHVLPLWTSLERKFEDSLSKSSLGE